MYYNKEMELQQVIRYKPLGYDRYYNRYWWIREPHHDPCRPTAHIYIEKVTCFFPLKISLTHHALTHYHTHIPHSQLLDTVLRRLLLTGVSMNPKKK